MMALLLSFIRSLSPDWGFQEFVRVQELFDPDAGFVTPPPGPAMIHFTVKMWKKPWGTIGGGEYDSKTATGMVGLENQVG